MPTELQSPEKPVVSGMMAKRGLKSRTGCVQCKLRKIKVRIRFLSHFSDESVFGSSGPLSRLIRNGLDDPDHLSLTFIPVSEHYQSVYFNNNCYGWNYWLCSNILPSKASQKQHFHLC